MGLLKSDLRISAGLLKEAAPDNHLLAYITPNERDMLIQAGGSGKMTPQGIPSFYVGEGMDFLTDANDVSAPQESQAALSQYYNTIAPIAYGLPTQQQTTQAPPPNAMGMAGGGAMMGAALGQMTGVGGGTGAMYGGLAGLLGGLL